MKHQNRQMKL